MTIYFFFSAWAVSVLFLQVTKPQWGVDLNLGFVATTIVTLLMSVIAPLILLYVMFSKPKEAPHVE